MGIDMESPQNIENEIEKDNTVCFLKVCIEGLQA
jgi:hypothetical protein